MTLSLVSLVLCACCVRLVCHWGLHWLMALCLPHGCVSCLHWQRDLLLLLLLLLRHWSHLDAVPGFCCLVFWAASCFDAIPPSTLCAATRADEAVCTCIMGGRPQCMRAGLQTCHRAGLVSTGDPSQLD